MRISLIVISRRRRAAGRSVVFVYLDPPMARNLKRASKAEEIPQSQIVREAITQWLEANGYQQAKRPKMKGAARKR